MNSIGFLSSLLSYYRPRLDVSALSDEEFIKEIAYLSKIREMEKEGSVNQVLQKILGGE